MIRVEFTLDPDVVIRVIANMLEKKQRTTKAKILERVRREYLMYGKSWNEYYSDPLLEYEPELRQKVIEVAKKYWEF